MEDRRQIGYPATGMERGVCFQGADRKTAGRGGDLHQDIPCPQDLEGQEGVALGKIMSSR